MSCEREKLAGATGQKQRRMFWIGVTAVMVGGAVQLNIGVGWIRGRETLAGEEEVKRQVKTVLIGKHKKEAMGKSTGE